MKNQIVGKIYLVGLPIGNLQDITLRAKEALEHGRVFITEDTRSLKNMFSQYGIKIQEQKFYSFHDHSSPAKLQKVLQMALEGEDLYVLSEAGSPLISDPAYPLVVEALKNKLEVDSISGVSSVMMALELSGLPPHPFTFHGFLPRTGGQQKEIFSQLKQGTHIFFEAPSRVLSSLEILSQILPLAQVVVARELTKKFQSVYRFMAKDFLQQNIQMLGEFVLLVYLSESSEVQNPHYAEAMEVLQSGGATKSLAKLLASLLSLPPKEIYQQLTDYKKKPS